MRINENWRIKIVKKIINSICSVSNEVLFVTLQDINELTQIFKIMKNVTTIALGLILSIVSLAQTPQSFKYQAVIRDIDGNVIKNESVNIMISILQDTETGISVYSEEHATITNSYGLINFNIGEGEVQSGVFSDIDWSSSQYFIQIGLSRNGGEFITLGTAPLLSVPYALHAKTVENSDDADADPANEIQDLVLDGNILTISKNNTATEIDLSKYLDTTLTEDEVDDFVSNNGYQLIVDDADVDTLNEIQNISIVGETIQLSKNGGAVTIPAKGWGNPITDEALFAVVNIIGDTVFAVYDGGVRIYVKEAGTKAARGGFAVASRSAAKGITQDIFNVTNDSVRIYLDEGTGTGKAARGGFAVASRSAAKGNKNIMSVSGDSIRMYIDEPTTKAARGGFAVASRSAAKGTVAKIMNMTKDNYFIGQESGKSITTGLYNSFFGYKSGILNSTGSNNTFIGYYTGLSNTEGSNNVFLGNKAGQATTTGTSNIFIGKQAGLNNTTGFSNIFIGVKAGKSNTRGVYNVQIGYLAGENSDTSYNTFVGYRSGRHTTLGAWNAFFGFQAGYSNITGEHNTFVGPNSGFFNTTGDDNTFVGYYSGVNCGAGSNNTYIGLYAGRSSSTSSASNNVAIGKESGYKMLSGYNNVLIGNQSGYSNTTGYNNVFMGNYAGKANTSARNNVAIGNNSLLNNTESTDNVAIGNSALQNLNLTGYACNVAIGQYALRSTTTGYGNVGVGWAALLGNVTGTYNTSIGYGANNSTPMPVITNSTAIGYWAHNNASNQVRIGNTSINEIGGYVAWSNLSDGRFKKMTKAGVPGLEFIMKLRPVIYHVDITKLNDFLNIPDSVRDLKSEVERGLKLETGFIAQDVEKAADEIGYDFSGIVKPKNKYSHYSLRYSEFVVPLVKAMQEQQTEIETLKSQIETVKTENQELKQQLNKIIELLK